MGKQYSRKELIEKLNNQKNQGNHILAVCAGSGLNAKLCEAGGADLNTLVHTGLIRQLGLPSITELEGSTNEAVKNMMKEQFRVTRELPFTAGINVSEIDKDVDLGTVIDEFMKYGFSGIMNYPTSGEIDSPEFVEMAEMGAIDAELKMLEKCRRNQDQGIGYDREIELIKIAHEKGIFTAVYAFTPEQARVMAKAGADLIAGHCGGTGGGLTGHKKTVTHEEGGRRLQQLADAAREVNPDVIVLGHGGPFATPEDVKLMYKYCDVDGFIGGSAVDRIPIEEAVTKAARGFKEC